MNNTISQRNAKVNNFPCNPCRIQRAQTKIISSFRFIDSLVEGSGLERVGVTAAPMEFNYPAVAQVFISLCVMYGIGIVVGWRGLALMTRTALIPSPFYTLSGHFSLKNILSRWSKVILLLISCNETWYFLISFLVFLGFDVNDFANFHRRFPLTSSFSLYLYIDKKI